MKARLKKYEGGGAEGKPIFAENRETLTSPIKNGWYNLVQINMSQRIIKNPLICEIELNSRSGSDIHNLIQLSLTFSSGMIGS